MPETRELSWYRQEAERLRRRAATIKNDDQLRNSYLGLAREHERLADIQKNAHRVREGVLIDGGRGGD